MSGMTRSMPSISSSGNMSPASMMTMSSPHSRASMFLPISPTPPSGMIRRGALAKERDLLGRPRLGLLGHRRGGEEEGEGREIGDEGVAERGLMEGGRGVVDGEDHEPVHGLSRLAVDPRDRLSDEEL